MSSELVKAAQIRAPNDSAAADNFGSKLYTVTASLLRNALPTEWRQQRWVSVRNMGLVGCWYGFSTRATAGVGTSVVLAAPVATDAGLSTQVGEYIEPGEVLDAELPDWGPGDSMFLLRIVATGTTSSLLVRLSDGQ